MNNAACNLKPIPLRVEDRWLLAAVAEVLLGQRVDEPPGIAEIDWGYLKRQASLHAVEPCLARYCESRAGDVPVAVLERMRQEQTNLRAYNFFLLQELGRLTGALEAKRIDVLAWKGPTLGVAAYGDLSLRQCADLDLLVRPTQMGEAVGELLRLGYRENEGENAHTRNLERASPKVIVDLHQMMVQPHFSVAMGADDLLAESVKVGALGLYIPVPSTERILLLLCIHGSKHVWERLAWICDVTLFIRANPKLDWKRLRDDAEACRITRMLNVGLLLAEGLSEGTVPTGQLDIARSDSRASSLASRVFVWLFLPESSHAMSFRKACFHLDMREAMRDRWPMLSHLLKQGFTPSDADKAVVALPSWLSFGYYLIRPLRLAARIVCRR